MGNRCCIRKDVNTNLEFNAVREDYYKKVKAVVGNEKKIITIQSLGKGKKLRDKIMMKVRKFIRKSKSERSEGEGVFVLDEVRPGIRQLRPEEKIPQLNNKVIEILKNVGPFMIEEKEMTLIKNEKLIKLGPVIMENNVIYKGTWSSKGDREGFGELFYTDGSKFEGFFVNDSMNGRGRIINIQGDYYEGELFNDKANGFGKYISADGVTYIGYWENDKQHGKGEEIYPDGSRFKGNFLNGDKQGRGKFMWHDGSNYDGSFFKNIIQGKGTYIWKDGRIFKGDWINNKMDGFGVFIWPDKKKYIGMYKDDKKSGDGVFFWPDGRKYEGSWFKGKQHGFGIMTINELKRYGEWKLGKKMRWINEKSEGFEFIFDKYKNLFNEELSNSFNSISNDAK